MFNNIYYSDVIWLSQHKCMLSMLIVIVHLIKIDKCKVVPHNDERHHDLIQMLFKNVG